MKQLILIDGSNYLFRAYHALPYLTNKKGDPTGAIYGVINMINKLPETYPNATICVIFDAKGKNFRHALYPEYKAHRTKMDDALSIQIAPLHTLIQALGFPLISIEGVEADDVIGTLAQQAIQSTLYNEVLISTGDKDMMQLVTEQITLIDTMKNKHTNIQGVIDKFGILPNQVIDLLALAGDKSDNIPGISKVGPKTAVKWLQTYGTLESIIENRHRITGKIGETLRQEYNILPLSKQLTTIKCNVDIGISIQDIQHQPIQLEYVTKTYERYEFKNLIKKLSEQATHANETPHMLTPTSSETQPLYHTVITQAQFTILLQKLKQTKLFAFDTETTSITAMDAQLVGLSFCLSDDEAYYIPLKHQYEHCPIQLPLETVLQTLKPLLENVNILKIAQNAKYDLQVLKNHDIHMRGLTFDTMLESYILDAHASRHDLNTLSSRYLNHTPITYESITGKGKSQICFSAVAVEEATQYAAEDAYLCWKLHHIFWPQLEDSPTLKNVFSTLEIPLISILQRIETNGVLIDAGYLNHLSKTLSEKIQLLEVEAHTLAKCTFNLSSSKQIRELLFDQLQLPVLKKTPGGAPSTSEEVLTELSVSYELPKVILEHRHLNKLKTTYTDTLPLMIHSKTGRIHTSYHQAVTITGRLSSSNPNLQNIPVKSDIGRSIRSAFLAPPKNILLAADYSQIELRIMAHLSKDQKLIQAFKDGKDIHSATAAEIFGLSEIDVGRDERRAAKAVNFGLIYGMSAFGLAKQLNISRGEANTYIETYFARYPGIKTYMDVNRERARKTGYVETLMGRRLYLADLQSRNIGKQRAAERIAINAPMQGTAADIIKKAMIDIQNWLDSTSLKTRMIMQVHDELVFEVPENEHTTVQSKIKSLMEQAFLLDVPLIVDIGTGANWNDAH